jgi:hypothetical protein
MCAFLLIAHVSPGAPAADISSEFSGSLGPDLSDYYRCVSKFDFPKVPDMDDPNNQALRITLPIMPDPDEQPECEHRGEVTEANKHLLRPGQDVRYSFRFRFDNSMKGKIGRRRLVMAQLKQREQGCALPRIFAVESRVNPTISVRVFEELESNVVAVQLAVSWVDVIKIPVGHVLMRSEEFFGAWHTLEIHTKAIPQGPKPEGGFVEGSVDGRRFNNSKYGKLPREPYGYPKFSGCNYFKFGLYADNENSPWTIYIDRFRRSQK